MIPRPPASKRRPACSRPGSPIIMDETPNPQSPTATEAPPAAAEPQPSAPAPATVPDKLWIDELHRETLLELTERAAKFHLKLNADKTRHHLVFDLLKFYAARGTELYADGVLEASPQGSGFLRWPIYNFRSLPQDVFVPAHLERQLFLRNGN